jgi:transcriptional regulator with XRE-family HTH domain
MENNLKQLRTRMKLTQSDVAKQLHVSKQTIYKWEQGLAPVAAVHFEVLKRILKVNADELERALVQTLLDAAFVQGNDQQLMNAVAARRYDSALLNAALHAFHASAHSIDAAPVIDLREENLKLREENLKLRERIFELEKQLASPRLTVSTASKSTLVEVK